MKEELKKSIEEYVEALGADGCHKGKRWKGYDVYIPEYQKHACVGLPYIVMAREGEVRFSTEEESLEYLSFSETEDAKGITSEN